MSSQFTRTIFNWVTIWFDYFYFSLPNKVTFVGSPRIRKNYFLRRFGRLLAHLHCHEIAHVGQHRLEIRYRAKDTRAINESATRVLVILFMQFYPFFLLSSSSILLRRLLNESSSLLCGLFSRAMEKLFFFHAEWERYFFLRVRHNMNDPCRCFHLKRHSATLVVLLGHLLKFTHSVCCSFNDNSRKTVSPP